MKHITKLVVALAVASLLLVGPAAAHVRSPRQSTLKLTASNTHGPEGQAR